MKEEQVVLVTEKDEVTGLMEKMEAHRKGVLHRAFSVFVFNQKGEILLQRRAMEKYHSPGLWANTCCSHPRQGETYLDAAHRRLQEEMGFDCPLEEAFHFIYNADVGQGLIEHELDHVIVGRYDKAPQLNPEEVMEYQWMDPLTIRQKLTKYPRNYTVWFRIVFEELFAWAMENGVIQAHGGSRPIGG